jgi:acetylglutamate kinase
MAVGSVVVKIGGEVLASPVELAALASDLAMLAKRGGRVLIVHGGGPQATDLQKRLGIETRQIAGRRVTDDATLDVMKMTLAGKLNVELCAALVAAGARPVGLHGASSLAVRAVKRPPKVITGGPPEPVDLGHVGDIVGFNTVLFATLQDAGYLPVIACLGADEHGHVYNINGDVVANQLAAEIQADHLFLVTSVPGVLKDVKDPASRIPTLTIAQANAAIADGTVTGGMIPKVEEAVSVIDRGVKQIHILGKLAAGDLVAAVDSPGAVGTTFTR